jgi:hypothetical protein
MAQVHLPLAPQRGFGETCRNDAWWASPLTAFVVFTAFIVYAAWASLQNAHYVHGNYLSPLYSPLLWSAHGAYDAAHAMFGAVPAWWPAALPYSGAFLVLWAPGGFRLTCYYYRGAYYKSHWASPPACAVGKPHRSYSGERALPLVLHNLHRYFMYLALGFIVVLSHDAWKAMWFADPATGQASFGIGVGTLVLTLNVVFLAGYTFGCHSLRHVIGGYKDRLSEAPIRRRLYLGVSWFNRLHPLWAWISLFWVAFADVYVRLLSMGIWKDWRIL